MLKQTQLCIGFIARHNIHDNDKEKSRKEKPKKRSSNHILCFMCVHASGFIVELYFNAIAIVIALDHFCSCLSQMKTTTNIFLFAWSKKQNFYDILCTMHKQAWAKKIWKQPKIAQPPPPPPSSASNILCAQCRILWGVQNDVLYRLVVVVESAIQFTPFVFQL